MSATLETLHTDGLAEFFVAGQGAGRFESARDFEVVEEYMRIGDLNVFSQQRAGPNDDQEALINSLRGGQINSVNVVHTDLATALNYLAFTNKTWRDNKSAQSLRPFRARYEGDPRAGGYAILAAGHSRQIGIAAVAAEEGYGPDATLIRTQPHEAKSIMDILRIQLAENIHSKPAPDRSFRAIAEMYLYMQAEDSRHKIPKRAFAKHFGISEQTLRDSLNYAALPDEFRKYADDGRLPMGILIALARARQAIVDAHTHTTEHDPEYMVTPDMDDQEMQLQRKIQTAKIEELTTGTLRMLLTRYNKLPKRTIMAGRAIIASHAEALRRRYAPPKIGRVVVDMESMFDTGISVEDQLRIDRDELVRNTKEYFAWDREAGRALAARIARAAGMNAGKYLDDVRDGMQEALDAQSVFSDA